MTYEKPIIIISGSSTDSKSVTAAMAQVRALGAEPKLITNHSERLKGKDSSGINALVEEHLNGVAGILLMGNNSDIDPAVYGAEKHTKTQNESDTPEGMARAAYEYITIAKAMEHRIPLMGICGGMQRVSAALGGDMEQYIPDLFKTDASQPDDNRHAQDVNLIAPYIPVEYIQVEKGTELAKLAGETKGMFAPSACELPEGIFMDNSIHRQSVKTPGKGLIVNAVSVEPDRPDIKIIEGLEADPNGPLKDWKVNLTQWHPEFGASDLSAKILKTFIESAHEYGKAHHLAIDTALVSAVKETAASIEQPKIEKLKSEYTPAPHSWAARVMALKGQTTGKGLVA